MVTRATVGHLRSYPYAMSHGHKDLLKRPILDDHVSRGKATVRRTLEVVCAFVCRIQLMLYLVMHYSDLRFDFIWACILSYKLTVKRDAESKLQKT